MFEHLQSLLILAFCHYNEILVHWNFWVVRVLGPCLRWKPKEDSSSKGHKSFICREEKGKAAWGTCSGTQNPVFGFTVFLLYCGKNMFWHEDFGANRCFLGRRGDIFPWLITVFGEHVDLQWSVFQHLIQAA
jgi:hypothetical protein